MRASAENDKVLGQFKATGIRPRFSDRLKTYGIDLSSVLFSNLNGPEASTRSTPMVGIPTSILHPGAGRLPGCRVGYGVAGAVVGVAPGAAAQAQHGGSAPLVGQ